MPCWQGGNNTRRALDLIDVVNRRDKSMLVLSLDAEKAFDLLTWSFMFEVLRSFGFRGQYLTALAGLCSSPSATKCLLQALSQPILI